MAGAALAAVLLMPVLAAAAGIVLAGNYLRPPRREWSASRSARGDAMLERVNARRADFEVTAPDGVTLRGWKAYAANPNGDWVLLFHGVRDNRSGNFGHAEFLLRSGFNVVLMDSRAHGASDGEMATYGWLERHDVRAIAAALYASEPVHCLFLLGTSMGAAIALQAAAIEPHVAGVVAEAAFANLREVSFDYAGLHLSPWLGKTLLRPASVVALFHAEQKAGFDVDDVSPERAVAARPFPVLLISGIDDNSVPPRHSVRIYAAAIGPKELWLVSGGRHSRLVRHVMEEYEQRVSGFFLRLHQSQAVQIENRTAQQQKTVKVFGGRSK
jgi:alpha-beta hydrolase superfamily lysophospholipase